eukprot:gene39912-49332_t
MFLPSSDGDSDGDVVINALLLDPNNVRGSPGVFQAAERLRSIAPNGGEETDRINDHLHSFATAFVEALNADLNVNYSLTRDEVPLSRDEQLTSYGLPGASDEELLARTRTLIKRKRHIDQLRLTVDSSMELAVTDQLTGLHNRRYMESQLKSLLARSSRGGPPVSVLIADIDHFKRVNDLFGHDAGDDVIREFAARLASNFRPRDLACRYGGEEFVVIMPETNAND